MAKTKKASSKKSTTKKVSKKVTATTEAAAPAATSEIRPATPLNPAIERMQRFLRGQKNFKEAQQQHFAKKFPRKS